MLPDANSEGSGAADLLRKYEAWALHLGDIRDSYVRRMPMYRSGFVLLSAAGFACFVFGPFPGLWGSISATFVSISGYLMVRTRIWELTSEIEDTQREVARLRGIIRAGPYRQLPSA